MCIRDRDSVKAKRQKQLQNDQASRQKAAQWQFQNGRYVDVMRDFAPQDRERYAFMPSENASERMAVALMRPVHGEEDQEQVWEYNRRVNACLLYTSIPWVPSSFRSRVTVFVMVCCS